MSTSLLSGPKSEPRSEPRSARATRAALVTGPALLFTGEILMALPDAWTVSHMIFLAGTVAMLPAAVVLYDVVGDAGPAWVRRSGLALTVAGGLTLAAQFVVDFVVMQLAAGDSEIAGTMFDRLQESPAFAIVVYTAGPALLFTGLALFGAASIARPGPKLVPGGLLVAGALLMGAAQLAGPRAGEVAGLGLILVALTRAGRPAGR